MNLNGTSKARGRNGWFVPRTVVVRDPNPGMGLGIGVEFSSNRIATNLPPICLDLSIEDAKTIVGQLTNALIDARAFDLPLAEGKRPCPDCLGYGNVSPRVNGVRLTSKCESCKGSGVTRG